VRLVHWSRLAGLIPLLVGAREAGAQRVVAASAALTFADHRLDAGFGVERRHGTVPGAGISVLFNPRLTVDVRARGGSLPADNAEMFDRKLGELTIDTRFKAIDWLTVEGGLMTRSFSNLLGGQRWFLLRTGVEGRMTMFSGAGGGILRASYAPLVRVGGLRTELALSAGAGLEYQMGPARGRVLFEVERYRFVPVGSTTRRHEQFSNLTAELALSFGGSR
jgi:hypothetical protein